MSIKILAISAMAVNLLVTQPTTEEPTLKQCQENFTSWMFHTELIRGFLRTPDGVAIALNEEVVDTLPEEAAAYVRDCINKLLEEDPSLDPNQWPLGPWEPGPEDEKNI